MKCTIKDVAEKAGVSIATVSRVINTPDSVNSEMRDKVLTAIDQLDYIPNQAAQSMKRKYNTIGLLVSDISVTFSSNIAKRIEKDCRSSGNLVLFFNTYDDPEIEKQGIIYMVQKQASVIIICSTGHNENYLKSLVKRGISVIFLDRRPINSNLFSSVYVNKKAGMYSILDYLVFNNHSKIAFISGNEQLITNIDRYNGICEFCRDRNLDISNMRSFFGKFTPEHGYNTVASFFENSAKWAPTAVITGSAAITVGVIEYCKTRGISIPYHLSLVSFEDIPLGNIIEPRLTYIDDSDGKIGDILISVVHQALEGYSNIQSLVVDPELIVNQSVRCLPKE